MTILDTIKARGGFVKEHEMDALKTSHPHEVLLTRCGCGRFVANPQDTQRLIVAIERERSDYVRDVSINPSVPPTTYTLTTSVGQLRGTKADCEHFAAILQRAGVQVQSLQAPDFQRLFEDTTAIFKDKP